MMPSIHDKTTSIIWSLLWFMLPLSMRGTLLFLWIFGIAVLVQLLRTGISKANRRQMIEAGLFFLFFIWLAVSLVFDTDHTLWWKSLEKKSALLVIPLLLIGLNQKKINLETWAIRGFISGLTISGITMIIYAAYRTLHGEGFTAWSYHNFASPFYLGAIYASWYFSAALIYLVFREQEPIIEKARPFLLISFILILFLLASKLFIVITIPVLFWKLFSKPIHSKKRLVTLGIVLLTIIGVASPFVLRISELNNSNLSVLKQKSYNYDTPFNGLTFRLLQWRLAENILAKEKSWITGVGMNSNQKKLDEIYQSLGIYTGNPDLGDRGYLGYNYHNQYLETLVGSGIPGLIILLLIIINIFLNQQSKLLFPLYVYIITVLFFFTESVLDRQAGIIFFCLIVFTDSNLNSLTSGSNTLRT